ncbi:MAG: DUF2092 domain-containing protein [Deltaproteobacteria bacterium]|nr:DUF2092 domain-containing protein [Deltaproteobacteria bacterium]
MAFITAMVCCPAFTASAADAPVIDTKADQVLRQMSDYVGSLGQFRVHLENSVDTFLDCRQMIQLSRSVDIFVKRPKCRSTSRSRMPRRASAGRPLRAAWQVFAAGPAAEPWS